MVFAKEAPFSYLASRSNDRLCITKIWHSLENVCSGIAQYSAYAILTFMKYTTDKKGNKYYTLTDLKREQMRDPEFRKHYEALKPKYDLIRAILDARIKKGVTQAQIAKRAGTTQSAIARFESGVGNPTLDFLQKISAAVGARLEVKILR